MQYALLSTSIVDRRLCTYFRNLHFVWIIFTLLVKLYINLYLQNCILTNFILIRTIYVFEIVTLRYWNFIIIHRNTLQKPRYRNNETLMISSSWNCSTANNLIIETIWYQRTIICVYTRPDFMIICFLWINSKKQKMEIFSEKELCILK